jgi:hypothetical protein
MAESPTEVRGRIFISYRREDAAYPAGWLFDRLAERFGSEQIFKDVDSIELGDDFVEVIGEAVGSTDVLLALIGDRWLTVVDEDGDRRLDDPEDFVRLEIEAALTRRVRVIPILVEGARMPREDQLPPTLSPLARRQALELSPSRFAADSGKLLAVLEKTLAEEFTRNYSPSERRTAHDPQTATHAGPAVSPSTPVARRTRPLAVSLALAGAGLAFIANTQGDPTPMGAIAAFAPETLGVPFLVTAVAILLQAGRIRERLAYGLLLGFGLLTTAGAIGIGLVSAQAFDDELGSAPAVIFLGAGVLVLLAGIVGAARDVRSPEAWGAPFRWGPASLLGVLGVVIGVAALFAPFGKAGDGQSGSLRDLGSKGLTGIVLEPITAIAIACIAAYALGKTGPVRLVAAGVALALGAQTALFHASLLGAVASNYRHFWEEGTYRPGFLVGFVAAGLMLAAGLVGRRSP